MVVIKFFSFHEQKIKTKILKDKGENMKIDLMSIIGNLNTIGAFIVGLFIITKYCISINNEVKKDVVNNNAKITLYTISNTGWYIISILAALIIVNTLNIYLFINRFKCPILLVFFLYFYIKTVKLKNISKTNDIFKESILPTLFYGLISGFLLVPIIVININKYNLYVFLSIMLLILDYIITMVSRGLRISSGTDVRIYFIDDKIIQHLPNEYVTISKNNNPLYLTAILHDEKTDFLLISLKDGSKQSNSVTKAIQDEKDRLFRIPKSQVLLIEPIKE